MIFILEFIDASAGYCISFDNFLELECYLWLEFSQKMLLLAFGLCLFYSQECCQWIKASLLKIDGGLLIGVKPIVQIKFLFGIWLVQMLATDFIFGLSKPWTYIVGVSPMQSTWIWSSLLQMLLVAFHFWIFGVGTAVIGESLQLVSKKQLLGL